MSIERKKQAQEEIIQDIASSLRSAFRDFVEARKAMDKASNTLKQLRLTMGLKDVFEAMLDHQDGELYLRLERVLFDTEKASITLRSFIKEHEKTYLDDTEGSTELH